MNIYVVFAHSILFELNYFVHDQMCHSSLFNMLCLILKEHWIIWKFSHKPLKHFIDIQHDSKCNSHYS